MDILRVILAMKSGVEGGIERLVGVATGLGRRIGALLWALLEMYAAGDQTEHGMELGETDISFYARDGRWGKRALRAP